MPVTIQTFSDKLRRYVLDVPIFMINDAVVDTIIEFAQMTEIFRVSIDNPEYVDGVDTDQNDEVLFTLNINKKRPFKLLSLAVGSDRFSLNENSLIFMKTVNNIANRADLLDSNKKYYSIPSNSIVSVFPIDTRELPDTPTYINFDLVTVPLSSIDEIDDEIYYDHRETIEAGAIARLLSQPGTAAWADKSTAYQYRKQFETAMATVTGNIFNKSLLPTMKRTSFL